jgi:hypothetical protein
VYVLVCLPQVNSWIATQSEVFSSGRHGNSRTEVETLLDAYSAYEEQVRPRVVVVVVVCVCVWGGGATG